MVRVGSCAPRLVSCLFTVSLMTAAGAAEQQSSPAVAKPKPVQQAVDEAHAALWSKFVSPHGFLFDYVGEIPTPEDCALGRPNCIGWWSPIENASMFTGLYLPAVCERARRSNATVDKDRARTLAQGLLKCASVSDVPGFIGRGVGTDGRCHYPLGSEDQTLPWFYGLHTYAQSGIPTPEERKRIVDKMTEVADALEAADWRCPCDGAFRGQFRGHFKAGAPFRGSAHYLFVLRAMYDVTEDKVWLERYRKECAGKHPGTDKTRLEICAEGYTADSHVIKNIEPGQFWIYVGAQGALRKLAAMETDETVRAYYRRGLDRNAANVLKFIDGYQRFDNQNQDGFHYARWREGYAWTPQKTQDDAQRVASSGRKEVLGTRKQYERSTMTNPLSAAAIAALAGRDSDRPAIERAIGYYDYTKINLGEFFLAECAYYALPPIGLAGQTEEHWPQFRGPGARGIANGPNLPERWSATENIAWKTDVPGRGWSSPIAWGNRVFLTTAVNSGELEPPKKGLYFGGNRPEPRAVQVEYRVRCLDLSSGKMRWEQTVHRGPPNSPIHLKNSFASETPVTDGERVYAYFGNQGLFCFDLEGRAVWSRRFEPHATRNGWGTAASPVLHGDRLYIVNDNDEQSYLVCLDKRTGQEVWRVVRDEKSNWSTPFIWQHDRRTEIVTPGTDKVRSYDLEGKLLWWFTGMSKITIATPYADKGLLYVSSGYVNDQQRPIYAIRAGASGDISLGPDQTSNKSIAWCQPKAAPYNPTTLLYDGRLYVLYDRSMLGCFRALTGEPVFERQRLPQGQHFTASPWAYNGKIFCLDEDGVTHVLRAGDKFEVLHTNKLGDDDMCMATPAIVGDRLVLRTSTRVYCVRNRDPRAPVPSG